MAGLSDPAVQQVASEHLKGVRNALRRASDSVERKPDQALREIRTAQRRLHKVIADAQASAQHWAKQQAESAARIAEIGARIDAAAGAAAKTSNVQLALARQKLAESGSLHSAGRYSEALARCQEAEAAIEDAAREAFDETVRREVVRGLLASLQDMGFIVEGPQLRKGDHRVGVVTLIGQMPSGKQARFEVHLDGRMEFDLDGYPGRACAGDLERMEDVLHDKFGIKLGPPQVTWKNPDRIAKGARDLPSGGGRQIGCR